MLRENNSDGDIMYYFAIHAADDKDIFKIYEDSYIGSERIDGVFTNIYALEDPRIVTSEESNALRYAFMKVIMERKNDEKI